MGEFSEKLKELHEYCKEYGRVISHSACDITGHHDEITSYAIEGRLISILTHDSDVVRVTL